MGNFRGVEESLNTIAPKMVVRADIEPLWLMHWLDENKISYNKSEEDDK